jgi:hypothetical protein
VASPQRARQYFGHFPPCFPVVAAPDRTLHRAYGLPEMIRSPEFVQETERKAAEILQGRGIEAPLGQARWVFLASGFEMTPEDQAEFQRPHQAVASFLIGSDGLIRWARVDPWIVPLPNVEELLSLI